MKDILIIKKSEMVSKLLGKGVLFSLLFVFFFYMGMNLLFPRQVIKVFKLQHFVISSTSMEPVFTPGDLIFVKPLDPSELEKDVIITFYTDVRLEGKKDVITHYFVREEIFNGKVVYRTRRAGTDRVDSWMIPKEDLIGQYSFHISQLGKIVLFFNHPLGLRIFLIDIIIVYLIILLVKDVDEDIDKSKYIKKN